MGISYSQPTETFENPWREIRPKGNFEELRNHYYDELSKFRPHEPLQFINALLLGQSASGKSSFINSCATALRQKERVLTLAGVCARRQNGCTGRFVQPLLKLKDDRTLPVRLYDCRGLHQPNGVLSDDVDDIIRGNVKPGYLIDPENRIDQHSEFYRENPEMGNRIHVIVHVAAADSNPPNLVDNDVKNQLQEEMNNWMCKADLPHVVLLTRMDRLGMKDTEKLFFNKDVKGACEKAEKVFGLPLNQVFPTINYSDKINPDAFHDFLALYNLWQIIQKGNDYVENNSPNAAPEGFRS